MEFLGQSISIAPIPPFCRNFGFHPGDLSSCSGIADMGWGITLSCLPVLGVVLILPLHRVLLLLMLPLSFRLLMILLLVDGLCAVAVKSLLLMGLEVHNECLTKEQHTYCLCNSRLFRKK